MLRGEELAYNALKKEVKRLSKATDKAKAEYDEYMNIHHEMISINQEFAEIVKSKEHGKHVLDKLNALKKRSDRCDRVRKKDLLRLIDRHIELQLDRDSVAEEMYMMEFRLGLKGRNLSKAGGK